MLMNQANQTEQELESSFSCDSPSVQVYHYFAVVLGSLVSVTGTVGNLMTILAFAFNSHLRTRFNVLIINLAVADLLYCTLLQPISIDSYLHLRWRCGALWCRIFGLLLFTSNAVSIITLCLIAVSRYLLVARSSLFHMVFSNRGLVLLLTFTWSFTLACFAPLWPVYVFVPNVCTCSFHRTKGLPYTSILLFFYFFVGLFCVGFFYLLIYRHVTFSAKALRRYRFSRRSSRKKPAVTLVEDETNCSVVTGSCRVEWNSQTDLNRTKVNRTDLDQRKQGRPKYGCTKQDQTDLNKTKLEQTNLGRTNVGWTKQYQTDLNQTKLDRTNLGQTSVGWTKLDRANLDENEKDRTNLCWHDLDRTTLDWTDQNQIEQHRTNLNRTKLDQTDLGQAMPDNHTEIRVMPAATVDSSAAQPSSTPPCEAPPPTTSSYSVTPADHRDVKRVTCMCFMVFLGFVFCFLPFLLINVLDKRNSAPPVLHMLCANLTWLNSCINPILYAVMNRQFRQAYRVLLTKAAMPFTWLWARC